MQNRHVIRVEFGKHITLENVASMRTGLVGNVRDGGDDRTFLVETVRDAHFARLKKVLLGWELHGFLRWSEVEQ